MLVVATARATVMKRRTLVIRIVVGAEILFAHSVKRLVVLVRLTAVAAMQTMMMFVILKTLVNWKRELIVMVVPTRVAIFVKLPSVQAVL